ncbi:hypothetical protein POM88_004823 [Heracleum sosnowskyi]|uniref:Uncharacterized protein n=1 Tax=Heracleum sosnowskyi TaxID=360622 RepID=A0AAD8JK40_9APIA|nr:hypothetical protein POM88_004823 [Heracleum sosnowskyi]
MGILDQLQWVVGRVIAVSSVVDQPFKPVSGGNQVYKGVKEEALKGGPLQLDYKKKPRGLSVMAEEMLAKIETVEEERNSATQLQSLSHCVKPLDNLKELLAEPSDELTPLKATRKKVFIRSRL